MLGTPNIMQLASFLPLWALFLCLVAAQNFLQSNSLLTCMDNSLVWANNFHVVYFPHNRTVLFDILAMTNINNVRVGVDVELIAYGLSLAQQNVSLCDLSSYKQLCPLTSGHLDIQFEYEVSESVNNKIRKEAYSIPDLDARVKMVMYNLENMDALACIEAIVSNGKTVQTKYAAWPIAVVSGLGLITSGVVSVIGHSSTAAHIAANSMSLFVYFQSLAVTAMLAVARVPPIAAAWSQNFMWSLGIIKVGLVQNMANWYLQSTGGSPTHVLMNPHMSVSVQKLKRSLLAVASNLRLQKRVQIATDNDSFFNSDKLNSTLYTTNEKEAEQGTKVLILRGIQRVAYMAGIEITSLFMTSISFFIFMAFILMVFLSFFKAIVEICVRSKIMNEGKFNEFRLQWTSVIKGSLYRLMLVALPQLVLMSIWEFTVRDSSAIVVIAIFFFLVSLTLMGYSAFRVLITGRRSVREHKNPAYLLYGDETFLNKFGFIYVQYRADRYWFVGLSFFYIFLKSVFVASMQSYGKVQSLIVFAIELIYCIIVCWIRPFMDKRTNVFNITIGVINALNALFFAFFSFVFKEPPVVASVMAVVYFVLNAAFALFLLIFTIVTCVLALIYKNPDARYQPMKDDRVSFLPRMGYKNQKDSASEGEIELMALGASARKGHEHVKESYVDDDSYDDDSKTKSTGYRPAYGDVKSFSKQPLLDSAGAQAPALTIVGNSTNAHKNYQPLGRAPNSLQQVPYHGYYERSGARNDAGRDFL